MPVILLADAYPIWLAPGDQPVAQLNELLVPYPSEEMVAFPVSKLVNSPQFDSEDLIKPTG
jgi:putative SOS response-associated peptidase YedK